MEDLTREMLDAQERARSFNEQERIALAEAGWHSLRNERDAMRARIAALETENARLRGIINATKDYDEADDDASWEAPHPIFQLVDERDTFMRLYHEMKDRAKKAEAENARLVAWLQHIEGGDSPCTDEEQLRQWAYEAVTLGSQAP